MQPEIVKQLPTGPNWQYELKWDGYRAIAIKKGQDVSLYSRNRNLLTRRYPTVVHQIQELPINEVVLDGELVVFDEEGRPSFQLLQNYSSKAGHPLAFVAFDVLNIEKHLTLSLPLVERQKLLTKLLSGSALQISEPLNAELAT